MELSIWGEQRERSDSLVNLDCLALVILQGNLCFLPSE